MEVGPQDISDVSHVPVELASMPESRTTLWLVLHKHGDLTAPELIDECGIPRGTHARALSDLRDAGLAEMRPNVENHNAPKYHALGDPVTVEEEDEMESRAFTPARASRGQVSTPALIGIATVFVGLVLLTGFAIGTCGVGL
ncbi:MarR family transcriptional regulator [Natrialba taiwanensis]|uniref:Uncharacterized protein n=1 Tax=Natrialba taiwanensis DSM 12281 TaxID=1230458 RepID=M0AD01_9EURY|nr:MarR family transcriptional regulator [Natrialba taiwanensis]ELY96620.1 hypothetical protein C484_00760 [Natrialba taiwanensis DSM 12281]